MNSFYSFQLNLSRSLLGDSAFSSSSCTGDKVVFSLASFAREALRPAEIFLGFSSSCNFSESDADSREVY